MLISLQEIIQRFDLQIKGVLHIGAHVGQEYPDYVNAGIKNMVFFEPVESNFLKLLENVNPLVDPSKGESVWFFGYALGNYDGKATMFIETANRGMSSSILEPVIHLQLYPYITFPKKEKVTIYKLDSILLDDRKKYNMINMDVQGYELEVLKGAVESLQYIDIIYTEINTDEIYKNCAKVKELDSFLKEFGFIRVMTKMACDSWGDALYIKEK